MTYFTIDQIKKANAAGGYPWFDPSTINFFRSRIAPGVIGGRYFVTSEQFSATSPRRYTVRIAHDNGSIGTIGEFMQYPSLGVARTAARHAAKENAE